jgi:UDP-N-acetylmuramate dehydrogenase
MKDTEISNNFIIFYNEPLKEHTTFKIGGPADVFAIVKDTEALRSILQKFNGLNFFVIGKGSNLVVSDKGFRGVVIKLGGDFEKIYVDSNSLICGSGVSLSSVCMVAMENELTGFEFAWGIPGTCGGAVFMNAGAYGGEISQVCESTTYMDENGKELSLCKKDLEFSYRKSFFSDKKFIITSAVFALKKDCRDDIKAKMDDLIVRRKAKQPIGLPNAGSVFRRPEVHFAGKLIQDCGLNGFKIGGAQVSEKHCGFIVNIGGASFEDVKSLVFYIQKTVYDQKGIQLKTEIEFLE